MLVFTFISKCSDNILAHGPHWKKKSMTNGEIEEE